MRFNFKYSHIMKTLFLFIGVLFILNPLKSHVPYSKYSKENQMHHWKMGIDFKNYCQYNSNPYELNAPINDYDWSMDYEKSTEDLLFLVDTSDNPRETFYVLTNGRIIDGIEFDKIIQDAWNIAFGDLTEEEKDLFSNTNLTISVDTLKK
jgi:hypothetical protein